MSPKSLLRHPKAVCTAGELADGRFMPFIKDPDIEKPKSVKRLVICSGKVYYDLLAAREEAGKNETIAIARLEQIYPFPDSDIQAELKTCENVKEVVWCQEEPKNMGSWSFVMPRLTGLLSKGQSLQYVGRQASAATATGQKKIHEAEQRQLLEKAIG